MFKTNNYGNVEVLEVLGTNKFMVKFIRSGNTKICYQNTLVSGNIRDTEESPVYTTGIQDIKGYLVKGQPNPKDYNTWNNMRQRCYNLNTQAKLYAKYPGCTMSEYFLMFSKFKVWFSKQVGFDQEGCHLDKDLLVKGNKIYSAETCVLLPSEINCALVTSGSRRGAFPQGVIFNSTKTRYRARIQRGDKWESLGAYDTPEEAFYVYKPVKEAHIKSLAEKWKDQIDLRAYEALMNWTIDIDD